MAGVAVVARKVSHAVSVARSASNVARVTHRIFPPASTRSVLHARLVAMVDADECIILPVCKVSHSCR